MKDETIDPNDYDDVIIFDYLPEIIAIHNDENDSWFYNVVLYQDHDKTAYRIRSSLQYKNKEDAIMDANGVIELLGYNLEEKILVSCFRVIEDDVIDDPIVFDGTDFYPYEGDDDDETNEDDIQIKEDTST